MGVNWQALTPAEGDEIIAHNDLAPWNLIIGDRLLGRRTQAMHAFLAEQAAQGNQPWTRLWQEGHGDVWHADTVYITEREGQWRGALLG